MMKPLILLSLCSLMLFQLPAQVIHVGSEYEFTNIAAAAPTAQPGDTLLIHEGTYSGGQFIYDLQGNSDQWITIKNAPGETVVFQGSTEALHFIDPAYVKVSGLIFEQQTGNGVNCDDGGDYETPALHMIFEDCIFRDMNASGNNDLLKLSGLDSFEVRNCQFLNGASGGSGIDMVGCHYGTFTDNYFDNMGSNAFQVKGGSAHIRIERNFFRNAGQRTLNLGGSTGLAYFRPDTAHYEAANIQVYSNIIIGSWAAVAYVGSVNVEVVNNTIYLPENWVIRILQETVDPERFLECGDNSFINNIVYMNNGLSTETNIGPNTRPETFTFSHNLWYNQDNTSWNGPNIPVDDDHIILNEDPGFENPSEGNFSIAPTSPAAGSGLFTGAPQMDYLEANFGNPPSIGAIEANPVSSNYTPGVLIQGIAVFPNPVSNSFMLDYQLLESGTVSVELISSEGKNMGLIFSGNQSTGHYRQPLKISGPAGIYWLRFTFNSKATIHLPVVKK